MRKPSLHDIVFQKLIPNPKQNDPLSFLAHVQRNLVPEVRLEVHVFYGSLDCLEAQYPGLDYTYPPHRRRLARHQWHRRLFRVFDELRLTDHEILSLCQWEGTRSAKERYEAETKRKIRDTTADDVAPIEVGSGPRARRYDWQHLPQRSPSVETLAQTGAMDLEQTTDNDEDGEADEVSSSIGIQLNQQLQAAVEARSRGETASGDAQWEQWLKEALERRERDDFSRDELVQAIRAGQELLPSSRNVSRQNTSLAMEADTTSIAPSVSTDSTAAIMFSAQMAQNEHFRNTLRDIVRTNSQVSTDTATLARLLETRSPAETARS